MIRKRQRKPVAPVREYRGVVIFRNTAPGYALRWGARTPEGARLGADTLAGIKSLIRDSQVQA